MASSEAEPLVEVASDVAVAASVEAAGVAAGERVAVASLLGLVEPPVPASAIGVLASVAEVACGSTVELAAVAVAIG